MIHRKWCPITEIICNCIVTFNLKGGDDCLKSPPNGVWKDESTYLKVESRHLAEHHRAFSPNTLRRKGENMAKALARIMITKVVDRRRKSDIEREAAQKVS